MLAMGRGNREKLPIRAVVVDARWWARELDEVLVVVWLLRNLDLRHPLLSVFVGEEPLQKPVAWPGLALCLEFVAVLAHDSSAIIDEEMSGRHDGL